MRSCLAWLRSLISLIFPGQRAIALENLALRHQLLVLNRQTVRPRLTDLDRLFWVALSRLWADWKQSLLIVQPKTVMDWQRRRFRRYWTKLSKSRGGRPGVSPETRALIRRMAKANPLWGAPRIHEELLKLGLEISERSVSRLMPKRSNEPSPSWRSFLANHVADLVSIDFFVVPTLRFKILFVFIVLAHHRRMVIHFNITEHPTSEWTAQQMLEAFSDTRTARYLIRDRDGVYGQVFRNQVQGLGINEVLIAPRSPWENGFAERMIGSIRRECLNHVVVLGERHLRRILKAYFDYYHGSRTHLSLSKDSPVQRPIQVKEAGPVSALPMVGGLHHRYERKAA